MHEWPPGRLVERPSAAHSGCIPRESERGVSLSEAPRGTGGRPGRQALIPGDRLGWAHRDIDAG